MGAVVPPSESDTDVEQPSEASGKPETKRKLRHRP